MANSPIPFTDDMIAKANAAFKPLFEAEVELKALANVITKLLPALELPVQDATQAFERMAKKESIDAKRQKQNTTDENECPNAKDTADPWTSKKERGAFIVFEGLDRAGKSTQSKELLTYMNKQDDKMNEEGRMNAGATWMCFPARKTPMGSLLDLYLRNKLEMPDKVVHLLFSANRWEMTSEIMSQVESGKTIICDRYAFSGVVYSVAKGVGMDPAWCRAPDIGLPLPDMVFFLHLDPAVGALRAAFGDERYENTEMQANVREQFEKADFANEVCWNGVDGGQEKAVISQQIQKIVEDFRGQPQPMPPLVPLWV